jgi:Iron only hydrogenase large subunit, C-terminal domain
MNLTQTRGIATCLTEHRQEIFTEVARLAYEGGDYSRMEDLPYKIAPGEVSNDRESIFLERAIIGERIRLAIGLPLRNVTEHTRLSDGVEDSAIAEKYYDPPLVNIITYACNACPTTNYKVSEGCQGCLARFCQEVCPKDAVRFERGKSVIDPEKCIKCGRCANACPYNAIIKQERPCAAACGMNAIESDEYGRAKINYDKCVSCGMCLVSCPFGAIADKGQIFQLIHSIKRGDKVIAIVAPAFYGQFGPAATPERLTAAMKKLGFHDVVEVAIGADLCTIEEAKDFLREVPEYQPFMATSCCPAWAMMAKKEFPEMARYISMAMTPMVLTARMTKAANPDCRIAFVGPCAAKKLEASRRSIRSDVDFVLTFEELQGMFKAKEVDFTTITKEEEIPLDQASSAGRGFAVGGGVAKAVVAAAKRIAPEREVNVVAAEGLAECKKMLMLAKAGKYNGFLLEGMACPGGCVAGAGTIQPIKKSAAAVELYAKTAPFENAVDTEYDITLPLLKD